MKSALLIGASGLIGGQCLNLLLDHADYEQVIVLVRAPLNRQHPKLIQHFIDFNDLGRYKELIQGNELYCCLGTTIKKAGSQEAFRRVDFTYPLEIAMVAQANGVRHLSLVSSVGAKSHAGAFYLKVKGELESALKQLGFPTLQVFRPSLLLGEREEFRFAEEVHKKLTPVYSFLLTGPLKKYRPIQAEAVAQAMVAYAQGAAQSFEVFESDQIQRHFHR